MKRALLLLGTGAAALAVAAYWQASRLTINGQLASTGVIERNGTAYVPLKDVAAALKMNLTKTGSGYELSDAGGANQVNGITGKVGDVLWNGYARFQVVEVIRTKKYIHRFSGEKNYEVTPYPEGSDLIVIICKIKNGTKEKQTAMLPGGENTALTDQSEHSIAPRNGLSIDVPSRGQELLPGAAVDFALIFDVPEGTKLKDLVYQVDFFTNKAVNERRFRVTMPQ